MNDDILARADVSKLMPDYDSQGERWWANLGAVLLANELGVPVMLTQYHALTFHVPGGDYTPDWLHILADGRLIVVEIKGSTKQKNYRDARSKLRAAAEMYRWATWYEAIVNKDGCEKLELIEG